MGVFSTKICPVCEKSTNALLQSGMKYEGINICTNCANILMKKQITVFNIKQQSIGQLKEIVDKQNTIKESNTACCPKCGSTSLTANKKGYGIGKGVVGAAVVGPLGLIAGNAGAKKVLVTCLNCGNQFKPGA